MVIWFSAHHINQCRFFFSFFCRLFLFIFHKYRNFLLPDAFTSCSFCCLFVCLLNSRNIQCNGKWERLKTSKVWLLNCKHPKWAWGSEFDFVKVYNEELIGALTYTFMFAQQRLFHISLNFCFLKTLFAKCNVVCFFSCVCVCWATFALKHTLCTHEKLMITYIFFPLTPWTN